MVSLTRRTLSASGIALLAGCATNTESGGPASPATPRAAAAIGSFGIDLASRDISVKPGDDFFQHVNGLWLNNPANAIPADRTTWGTNALLQEKAERDVKAIIEDAAASGGAPGSNAQKVADFYNAHLNQDAIDARGLEPLQPVLAEIAALRTHDDVMRLVARPEIGVSMPIDIYIGLDEGNPDRYLVTLTHGGNTSSGTSGSQSNGGGAYKRVRYPSEVRGYALVRYPGE